MVQAIINIDERTNRILNIIKAKFALKDKSQAIDAMAKSYEENILEPELRPEYVQRLSQIKKEKGTRYKDLNELRRRIENA